MSTIPNHYARFHLRVAHFFSKLLDDQFGIGKFRFGLDPLLGLIPGFGDIISFALSLYIVAIGIMLRLPSDKIGLMIKNVMVDFLIGLLPLIGDIADVAYKANKKNLAIIHDHVEKDVIEAEML